MFQDAFIISKLSKYRILKGSIKVKAINKRSINKYNMKLKVCRTKLK